jgi:hypothetical protein
MIHNVIRGIGSANDFIGQLTPTDFVLVTTPANLQSLSERILSRLEESVDYFYPLEDRDKGFRDRKRLGIRSNQLTADAGPFEGLGALKSKLLELRDM